MSKRWSQVSPICYINPEMGNIKFFGDSWEATPRFHFDKEMHRFHSLKEAQEWMESLLPEITVYNPITPG